MFPTELHCPQLGVSDSDEKTIVLEKYCHENLDYRDLYERVYAKEDEREIFEYLFDTPAHSLKDVYETINEAETRWEEGTLASYAIITPDDEFAGRLTVTIDWELDSAEMILWLLEDQQNRGLGYTSLIVGVMLIFEYLDIGMAVGRVDVENQRMDELMQGFVDSYMGRFEGRLHNAVLRNGEPTDVHRYTFPKEEYYEALSEHEWVQDYMDSIELIEGS